MKFSENESVTVFAKRDKTNAKKQAQVNIAQDWPSPWIFSKIRNQVKTVTIYFLRLTCKITYK